MRAILRHFRPTAGCKRARSYRLLCCELVITGLHCHLANVSQFVQLYVQNAVVNNWSHRITPSPCYDFDFCIRKYIPLSFVISFNNSVVRFSAGFTNARVQFRKKCRAGLISAYLLIIKMVQKYTNNNKQKSCKTRK